MKKCKTVIITACAMIMSAAGTIVFSQETIDDIIINNRGVKYGESNRLDEAIQEFDRAIEMRNKGSAKAYHNKGYALEKKGNLPEAIKNYEEAWTRNPKQIVTGERLGHAYYQTKDYDRAVTVGEAVMKLDPKNKNVPPWLEDAYKKRGGVAETPPVFLLSLEAMGRMGQFYGTKSHYYGLYYTSPHGLRYVPDDGLIVSVPYTIFMQIAPVPLFQMNFTVENPWLGALNPGGLAVQQEKGEFVFNIKNVSFGAGLMVTHYNSRAAFYRRYNLTDYKVGFIFGYKKDKVEGKITWYPRMLIMDPRSSTGKTLDVGSLRLDYSYEVFPAVRLHVLFNFRDYYVFCHSLDWRVFYATFYRKCQDLASYWGLYDMGFGLTFHDLVKRADGAELFSVTFEWLERFYLRDLNHTNPYTLAPNGQGWFGLNLGKFAKGKPFSGFSALSQVLSLRFDEKFTRNFFMYQKLIAELADQNSEHHEFNLQLGMGIKF
jgi:tetratricopeptide (TPR) repeat protein